ncbi:MAG: hypothetical protein D6737_12460 [Chloroflexi bacterium]|nr:MAG: hypothetical protein D6737_12460 [Chloroflexota bacterium]
MVKHLPPSAATLHLLDVGGYAGDILKQHRADLNVSTVTASPERWQLTDDSLDAVVAFDYTMTDVLLSATHAALRPGGRLTIVLPAATPDSRYVEMLEATGYVRILVEPALPDGSGVLIRGEKPHTTADTIARVEQVAQRDDNTDDLDSYRGRYVHLLVVQTPNKPAWALQPDETITWEALAITSAEAPLLLAFSSLPRAVNFMQQAIVAGTMQGINKMPKFKREVVQSWTHSVILNPAPDILDDHSIQMLPIDPDTAEAPDE